MDKKTLRSKKNFFFIFYGSSWKMVSRAQNKGENPNQRNIEDFFIISTHSENKQFA
jgi:hypothetical protein